MRLELDPDDRFGAKTTSSGSASLMEPPWNDAADVPLGVADSLDGTSTQAAIDLRGSRFAFAAGVTFCVNQEGNESSAVILPDRRRASLTAVDVAGRARATVSNSCLTRATLEAIASAIPIEYTGD